MSRHYNFSPGPSMIPQIVIEKVQCELLDWRGLGMSVMEISHRSESFLKLVDETEKKLRSLIKIPDNYKVLYMHGGASMQASAVPLNLANINSSSDYIITGQWGTKAEQEGQKYCKTNVIIDTTKQLRVPSQQELTINPTSSYLHYTPNETISGVEFHYTPKTAGIPLVADMSSNILSKPIDISKFGVIYAGMQKNSGIAGLCLVIVREDLLGKQQQQTPKLLNWKHISETDSMSNTPPTFAWYLAGEIFNWIDELGGVEQMAVINKQKADLLYNYIDQSPFYYNPVEVASRSMMNVPFTLSDHLLDNPFLQQALQAGLSNLKGHRVIGGMRASIYNAMPIEGIYKLISFMDEFVKNNRL